jgi:hypothetical protein
MSSNHRFVSVSILRAPCGQMMEYLFFSPGYASPDCGETVESLSHG